MKIRFLFFLFAAFLLAACTGNADVEMREHFSGSGVDIFYVTSTDVIESVDSAGNEHLNAMLTDGELSAVNAEINYIIDLFGDSFNVYSPLYHQVTLNALFSDSKDIPLAFDSAFSEVSRSFDHYMKHENHGRPFVLMGFSQGAIHALSLLKSLSDKQMNQLVAVYLLGYRISADDILNSNVRPAQSADDLHVAVSFNSVADSTGLFPFVADGAVTAINPVSWTTSAAPAELFFNGDSLSVSLSPDDHLLYVSGIPDGKYSLPALAPYCNSKCLHHADILMYMQSIKTNMLHRASLLRTKH